MNEHIKHKFGILSKIVTAMLCSVFILPIGWASVVLAADDRTCLNVSGKWRGYLKLANSELREIQADIQQDGCFISISTTSIFPYGQSFVGLLNDWDFIQVDDQTTHETWTTLFERATRDHIQLYDYVNNYSQLDEIVLNRIVMKGDIDYNSIVDLADAVLSLRIVAQQKTGSDVSAWCDVDDDGQIGLAETIYIIQCLIGKK